MMKNILEIIAEKTKERILADEKAVPLAVLKEKIALRQAEENATGKELPDFLQALKKKGMSYICEVKKASPFI